MGAILILIGIAVSSRIVAFLGSLLGTSSMYYINDEYDSQRNLVNEHIYIGLWGYNSAIIAGMFIKLSFRSVVMTTIFSIFVQSAIINLSLIHI